MNQESQAVRQHYDQALVVDPTAPVRMVATSSNRHDGACFVHRSSDAGATWTSGVLLPPAGASGCSGMAPSFGPDGTLYITYNAVVAGRRTLLLARSFDDGASFENSDLGFDSVFSTAVAVDVTDGPRRGTIYVAYIPTSRPPNRRATVIASTDGGATFSAPVTVAPLTEQVTGRVQLDVAPTGELLLAYLDFTESLVPIAAIVFSGIPDLPEATPMSAHVARSNDGGRTFTQVQVDGQLGGGIIANVQTVVPFPVVAVDPEDATKAYLVVSDRRRGGDWDVYFYRSVDGGRTWTKAARLNDDPLSPRRDQVMPWIDVAPGGRVEVVWLDRRDDSGNRLGRPYRTFSSDAGRTWSRNEPLTDVIFDTSIGSPGQAPTSYLGDRLSVYASADRSYVIWPDTRNGDEDNGTHDLYGRAVQQPGAHPAAVEVNVKFRSQSGPQLPATGGTAGGSTALVLLTLAAVGRRLTTKTTRRRDDIDGH